MGISLRRIVVASLCVGFTAVSCAFDHESAGPSALDNETVQSTMLTGPLGQQGKKFSAVDNDADCVLTTADIHLWCKWIARYY